MIRALSVLLTLLPLAARAETLTVATSFTVIADMARNVGGDLASVQSITPPGAEIHGYQPSPRDIIGIAEADLVLVNGLNLDAWANQFLDRLDDVPIVTVSEGIEPLPITGGDYDGLPNPHGWMALTSALIYVDNIARAMAEADPDNAQGYQANADAYKDRIAGVIGPLRDRALALPEDRRFLVTSEGAFSYLARDFGLTEMFLWPINAEGQGTPQQVRGLIDAMRETGAPVIFSESTVSDRPARSIAAETGADYGGILYVDSLSEADGPVPTYLDLLRVTSETILDSLEDE
ncbi:metal ABC transporter substrate-binding protein [Paracoccus liaowanqingii]|uniref:Metal ABC transporter substrate-binding protein n=1 Tax=Paracoccus liaowanqingii TaxID=2560053 RepID=A0A4P7HL23_9RHOB|nr:metal ABC transporter substrate-binding protein [Paracoccus liaowanqingii]QBX34856.1 metal ABC transporter substrate-binding protein [Paracoccus liaowanqingii]